ncbi:hypothetical protein EAF04_007072 [Stromatinia cepivora]|nr:hypothetical protein EAF04_007072 [Stromatinia cepivora]
MDLQRNMDLIQNTGLQQQEDSSDDGIAANITNGSLCETCAQSFILDDARAGGALEISPEGGKARLSFPAVKTLFWLGPVPKMSVDLSLHHFYPNYRMSVDFAARSKASSTKLSVNLICGRNRRRKLAFRCNIYGPKTNTTLFLPFTTLFMEITKSGFMLRHVRRVSIAGQGHQLIYTYVENGTHLNDTIRSRNLTERKTKIVQHWIEECASQFVPSRLLDIGSKGENNSFIRLVDSKTIYLPENAPTLKYICLSYCWGTDSDGKLLKTTEETVEQCKKQIPMDTSMPIVFRDVIYVAGELGIDTLCIIQEGDNGQDWAKQSITIGEIFIHAWMTIAAAVPYSCHESLFYPRYNHSIKIGFKSSLHPDIAGNLTIILISDSSSLFLDPLKNSRWNSRGWVWHEQYLSQRLLMFNKYTLHLRRHCRELTEFGEYGEYAHRVCTAFPNNDLKDWSFLATDYSKRRLNNPGDRLAAIPGFVKSVAKTKKDRGESATYLAGIWLSADVSLGDQLLLINFAPSLSYNKLLREHSDPEKYLAPSWSWESLNACQQLPPRLRETNFCKLVAYNVEPVSEDSDATVAIKPGSSITLAGKLRKLPWVSLDCDHIPKIEIHEEGAYKRCVVEYSCCMKDENDESAGVPYQRKNWGYTRYFTDWISSLEDFEGRIVDSKLKLFLISETKEEEWLKARGLILFPVKERNLEKSLFRKVGCFMIRGAWDSPEWEDAEVTII